jgi:formate/nitrite transporter FocA (FNT family)
MQGDAASGAGSGNTVTLSDEEEADVRELSPPRAAVVFETIRREGENELAQPALSLLWSALAAGMSMGFSLLGVALIRAALPDTPWRPLIENFGYTIGFLIVILGCQQLFTENTLTVILPLFDNPNKV